MIGFFEGLLGFQIGGVDMPDGEGGVRKMGGVGIISLALTLGTLIPYIAVTVRRMHDVGKSGWFMLIPIYNLILTLTEGDRGSNQYGSDPKSASDREDIQQGF